MSVKRRIIVQFSCGAASAVAAKLTIARFGPQVIIRNAFIQEEHEDNRRFLTDCERWLNHPIEVLRDEKYNSSTHEVWRRKRFIKGQHGAPCAQELKRKLLNADHQDSDIVVIGFTAEEHGRLVDLEQMFPDWRIDAPLIEKNLSKADCLAIIERAHIELPIMYRLGYNNANCIGCPKGGNGYWNKIRRDFPEQFIRIADIQESIGEGAKFLRNRRTGERIFLRELDPTHGDEPDDPEISCSFFCQMAEQDIEAAMAEEPSA